MNHIIDEYAGVIIGLIVSYSMINILGNIFTGVIRIRRMLLIHTEKQ